MQSEQLGVDKDVKRWIGATVSAIGFLSLFQDNLNLGDMLGGLIAAYDQVRDVLFLPLDLIDFSLPDRTKSLLLFLVILAPTFLLRGDKANRVAATCLIASIGWITAFVLGMLILGLLGIGVVFGEIDTNGHANASIVTNLLYFVFLALAIPVMFCILFPEMWIILTLFPFLGFFIKRIPFFGDFVWGILLFQTAITYKILESKFGFNLEGDPTDEVEAFSRWWGLQSYVDYYRPLAQVILIAGALAFFGKVILDTLF